MTRLHQIQAAVSARADAMIATRGDWPCRKGCDDCCRRLASLPVVSEVEWRAIAGALDAMPRESAADAWRRIRESRGASRPVVCPLLDRDSGSCLIYEARPVACRAYGFYVDRDGVLGCQQIEAIETNRDREGAALIWGNHEALQDDLRTLGPAADIVEWLDRTDG